MFGNNDDEMFEEFQREANRTQRSVRLGAMAALAVMVGLGAAIVWAVVRVITHFAGV